MADTAAHLVDRVLPEVPVRQWVLSLPWQLRYRLAYDAPLVQEILGIFVRVVLASRRRRARAHWGVARSQGGAVPFVQRFGDALELNVHFHSLVLDGVYAHTLEGALRFHVLPPPEGAEVARVAIQVARRIQRLLERRGLVDEEEGDWLAEENPLLAAIYAASIGGRIATGPRAGQRVRRLGDRIDADHVEVLEGKRCASVGGAGRATVSAASKCPPTSPSSATDSIVARERRSCSASSSAAPPVACRCPTADSLLSESDRHVERHRTRTARLFAVSILVFERRDLK